MDAKTYLEQGLKLNEIIKVNIEELNNLKELALLVVNNDSSEVMEIINKIQEVEKLISNDIDKFLSLKLEIRNVIGKVEDMEQQLVLRYRYLNFNQFKEIVSKLNSSARVVYRLHAEALSNIKVPKMVA